MTLDKPFVLDVIQEGSARTGHYHQLIGTNDQLVSCCPQCTMMSTVLEFFATGGRANWGHLPKCSIDRLPDERRGEDTSSSEDLPWPTGNIGSTRDTVSLQPIRRAPDRWWEPPPRASLRAVPHANNRPSRRGNPSAGLGCWHNYGAVPNPFQPSMGA